MLSRHILALISVFLLVNLAACESPFEIDLKAFCAIVHEVKAEKTTPPKKVKLVQKRVAAEVKGAEFTALYATIVAAPADDRYDILQKAAEDEGMAMWTCFDGRNLWKELGQHERMAAFDAELAKREGGQPVAAKTDRSAKKKKKKKKRKKRR